MSKLPEWALPLVDRIRNAVIERPGDVDCTTVLQAVLDGLGDVEVPETATDFAGRIFTPQGLGVFSPRELGKVYRTILRSMAEELRDAS